MSNPDVEKLRDYATAPRASARLIHQIEDGNFVPYWVAMLRGKAVALNISEGKFKSREAAVQHAREFRASCQRDLEAAQQ